MNKSRNPRGFAIVLAICLLATVAGLAGASFYALREARRAATRFAAQEEAASRADEALAARLSSWGAGSRDSLMVGATDSADSPGGSLRRSYVTRITSTLYRVTGVGRSAVGTQAEAKRAQALLVRLPRPQFPMSAAILSAGDVILSRDAIVSGDDRAPPGWDDCPPVDSGLVPPIVVPEGQTVQDDAGVPVASRVDPIAGESATYKVFGAVTAADLARRADIELPAGAMVAPHPSLGDECGTTSDSVSWGEPLPSADSPRCRRFFPIIHAAGDIVVTAGRGQGLLLVDGRLRIEGPFVFNGVILATGALETRGSGVTVYGAVLSAGADVLRWLAAGVVQRSSCAVNRASTGASRPVPVERRAWSDLF